MSIMRICWMQYQRLPIQSLAEKMFVRHTMGGFRGGKGAMPPPKRQKSPFALCIIVLQLQVMQALIHCPFNTNTADTCQLNPISGF